MNYFVTRSIGAGVTLGLLGYYAARQGVEGNYNVLIGAMLFELIVFWYFANVPVTLQRSGFYSSVRDYIGSVTAILLITLLVIGWFYDSAIPGSYFDWVILWSVIGFRIYEDYVKFTDFHDHLLWQTLPIGAAAVSWYLVQESTSLFTDTLHGVIFLFAARETADWFFDVVRHWARGKS